MRALPIVTVLAASACTDEVCVRVATHEARDVTATLERDGTALVVVDPSGEAITSRRRDGRQSTELQLRLGLVSDRWASMFVTVDLGGSPRLETRSLSDLDGLIRIPGPTGSLVDIGAPLGTLRLDHYDVTCGRADPDDDASRWACATDIDVILDATIAYGGEMHHAVASLSQRDDLVGECSQCTAFERCHD